MSDAPLLTPESARELLRECVTVVKPGEVLAVRLPLNVTGDDLERAREYGKLIERQTGVKVTFVPGEDFSVVQRETDEVFAERVEKALGRMNALARTRRRADSR